MALSFVELTADFPQFLFLVVRRQNGHQTSTAELRNVPVETHARRQAGGPNGAVGGPCTTSAEKRSRRARRAQQLRPAGRARVAQGISRKGKGLEEKEGKCEAVGRL